MSDRQAQRAYFVLADISGFVAFLGGVELDHAQEILAELLALIKRGFEPLLTTAEVYGDAVLAVAPASRFARGETLLELLEATYAAFRDRLLTICRHTACTCRACRTAPALNLKFLVHYGAYVTQRLRAADTLLGLDVDLVRNRALKTHVLDAHASSGYVLFTQAATEQLGLSTEAMSANTTEHEHYGALTTYQFDLQARDEQMRAARKVIVTENEAYATLMREFDVPPVLVWEWLNDPSKRTRWMRGRRWSSGARLLGRTAAGARNHCEHGMGSIVETILDWHPFDYFTVQLTPAAGAFAMLQTSQLESLDDGRRTRLH
ncbi:MAG: DUF2652 domain-containing protein, partial [Chloroflexi bacterium]|nr:DUF2652 domain-containing protein [Chloroflexota bacterium]